MAAEKPSLDQALEELASLGRRIAELATDFEARRQVESARGDPKAHADAPAGPPPEQAADPADAAPAESAATATGSDQGRPVLPVPRRRPASGRPRRPEPRPADERPAIHPPALREPAGDGPASPGRGPSGARRIVSRKRPSSTQPPAAVRAARLGSIAWPWRTRPAAPVVASTLVHVAALVALALVFIARDPPREPVSIISGPVAEEPLDDLTEFDVTTLEPSVPTELADPLAEPEPPGDLPEPAVSDVVASDAAALLSDDHAQTAATATSLAGDTPGVDIPAGDLLAALGDDAAGEAAAGTPAAGTAAGATFFGRRGVGRTALFMCDNSASYAEGGFQAVLLELSRAVALMKPGQEFHVVFFSDTVYPMFHPEAIDTFLPATPEHKRKLDLWLGTVELCVGGQGIRGAAALAGTLEPDVVYFLSDGDHGESVVARMVSLPLDDTVVHTFGMQADVLDRRTGLPDGRKLADQQRRNHNLLRIAEAHRGTFTPVTIPPQAALAASVRPVAKNRTRGPVWGLTLPAAAP